METIGVAGLGLLGRGIAAALVGAGFRVIAYARTGAEHAEARHEIAIALHELVEHAVCEHALLEEWPERYLAVDDLAKFANCDFVIESVVEDYAVKSNVFDQIEAVVDDSTPIASNTSAIPIGKLQSCRRRPERFLGMHWAEPAHATRFLELIRGPETSDETFAAAAALAKRMGKEPCLVQRDVPGFIVNRLGYAMYREAIHLLEAGVADTETIDRAFRNAAGLWATLCGPLRWIDLTGGPALYAKAMEGVLPSLASSPELPDSLKALVNADARRVANGHGFYDYTPEEAELWKSRYRERVWAVRELNEKTFPLETSLCR